MKQRKLTSENPLVGALSFLSSMSEAMTDSYRKDAFTDEFEGVVVDTCCPPDTHIWETGILRGNIEGKWVIVGQYESREEAETEHKKWVTYLKENPVCNLKDIDMWNLGLNEKD
uniref:Uncharacterized protein n=1 Tax=viral metagenome TaxID=1070528 RepID=A0A6M3KJG0_9ZZZZ